MIVIKPFFTFCTDVLVLYTIFFLLRREHLRGTSPTPSEGAGGSVGFPAWKPRPMAQKRKVPLCCRPDIYLVFALTHLRPTLSPGEAQAKIRGIRPTRLRPPLLEGPIRTHVSPLSSSSRGLLLQNYGFAKGGYWPFTFSRLLPRPAARDPPQSCRSNRSGRIVSTVCWPNIDSEPVSKSIRGIPDRTLVLYTCHIGVSKSSLNFFSEKYFVILGVWFWLWLSVYGCKIFVWKEREQF